MPSYPWRTAQLQGIFLIRLLSIAPQSNPPSFYTAANMGGAANTGFIDYTNPPIGSAGVQQQPCYNNSGVKTVATAWNTAQKSNTNAGYFTLANGGNQPLWYGFDTFDSITSPAILPAGGYNWLCWSGSAVGAAPDFISAPWLCQAGVTGGEVGRWQIRLDNAALNQVFQQQPGDPLPFDYGTWGLASCGNYWYCCMNAQVSPPSILVFSPDCSQYWWYVLVATDQQTLDALPSIVQAAPNGAAAVLELPAIGPKDSGNLLLNMTADFGSTFFLAENNARPLLLPPFPPILNMPCVPCVPLQINGNTWQGRNS